MWTAALKQPCFVEIGEREYCYPAGGGCIPKAARHTGYARITRVTFGSNALICVRGVSSRPRGDLRTGSDLPSVARAQARMGSASRSLKPIPAAQAMLQILKWAERD